MQDFCNGIWDIHIGIGALTPIGNNLDDYWSSLIGGVSGAAPITHFDASKFKTRFACEVKGFNVKEFIHPKIARKLDKFSQYALVVAEEAINKSKIDIADPYRSLEDPFSEKTK